MWNVDGRTQAQITYQSLTQGCLPLVLNNKIKNEIIIIIIIIITIIKIIITIIKIIIIIIIIIIIW